jgi:hypothetical protein
MLWASLFKELLKVVCGWPPLALAAACNLRSMAHTGATCSLVDAAIVVSRGLLAALFSNLLATYGTLHGILDGDIG